MLKRWLLGVLPLLILVTLVMPISATMTTHDVTYNVWMQTDRTSVEITAERFDATDMDWNADWTLDDYSEVETIYVDLFTEEMSYDFYIHNAERHQVDIDIVGVIHFRANDEQEFARLRYFGTTGTLNAGDSRAGTIPDGEPLDPDRDVAGWQIGSQFMVVWYFLEHPTTDPSDYEYVIGAVIIEVGADDYVPIAPPTEDEPTTETPTEDEDTTEEETITRTWWQQILDFFQSLLDRFLGENG